MRKFSTSKRQKEVQFYKEARRLSLASGGGVKNSHQAAATDLVNSGAANRTGMAANFGVNSGTGAFSSHTSSFGGGPPAAEVMNSF